MRLEKGNVEKTNAPRFWHAWARLDAGEIDAVMTEPNSTMLSREKKDREGKWIVEHHDGPTGDGWLMLALQCEHHRSPVPQNANLHV